MMQQNFCHYDAYKRILSQKIINDQDQLNDQAEIFFKKK